MCPRAPVYPAECIDEEPQQWRDDEPGVEGCECPVWLGHQYADLIAMWSWRAKGFLPYAGTWTEQPNYVIEAMNIIDAEVEKAEEEKRKQLTAEQT